MSTSEYLQHLKVSMYKRTMHHVTWISPLYYVPLVISPHEFGRQAISIIDIGNKNLATKRVD